jgi:hypothetical protein
MAEFTSAEKRVIEICVRIAALEYQILCEIDEAEVSKLESEREDIGRDFDSLVESKEGKQIIDSVLQKVTS